MSKRIATILMLLLTINLMFSERVTAIQTEKNDISENWAVLDYNSDLQIPLENIFVTGKTRPDTSIRFASVNFSNIGNSNFKAQKIVELKKDKRYHFKFLYSIRSEGNAQGSIDFNGDVKELIGMDQIYETEIIPKQDQDYVIQMEFNAPKRTGIFLMVGFDENDPDGGITERPLVTEPTVTTPESKTSIVKGVGVTGQTIRVIDTSNALIGETQVDNNKQFTVETIRPLRYQEELTVIQSNDEHLESNPVTTVVGDTIAPDKPVINEIQESDYLVKGQAEPESKIEVKNKNNELIGQSDANADGEIDFKLDNEVSLKDFVFVTATDEAGNTSEPTVVSIIPVTLDPDPSPNPDPNLGLEISDVPEKEDSKVGFNGMTETLKKEHAKPRVTVSPSKNRLIKNELPNTGEAINWSYPVLGIVFLLVGLVLYRKEWTNDF